MRPGVALDPDSPEAPGAVARLAVCTPPKRAADASRLALGPLNDLLGFHIARAGVTTFALFEQHVGQPYGLRKVEY